MRKVILILLVLLIASTSQAKNYGKITAFGDIEVDSDSNKIYFGADQDASAYYDGTVLWLQDDGQSITLDQIADKVNEAPGAGTGDLLANGTIPLTADWNVGAFDITAIEFKGALIGNSSTATALAANGADCAIGSYPLGVDASGAVVSCTDATTEINTEIGNVLDGTDAFTDFNGIDIINSDNYAAGSVDLEHMSSASVDSDNIVDDTINEVDLNMTGACTDNYIVSYDLASGGFTCVVDATGSAPATADISDVSVTQTELAELETIGATTISAAQWTALGGATTAGLSILDDATVAAMLVTQGLTATAAEINTPLDGATVTLTEFEELATMGATVMEAADWTAAAALAGVNTGDQTITNTKCIYMEDPIAESLLSVYHSNSNQTVNSIWCESDQTVNVDFQIDDGTAAAVNGSNIACTSTPTQDDTMAGDTDFDDTDELDLVIASVSGTPTWLSICIELTVD